MSHWGTPEERFWEKVAKGAPGECWVWIGGRKATGYGQFAVNGRKVIAHRWAHEHFIGPIPESYQVDHVCRNRSCVNPAHLEAVPARVNYDRRNAARAACPSGHGYTEENTYWYIGRDGYRSRMCRACRATHSRRRKERVAA